MRFIRNHKGFSLMELLVVTGIIAIMAGVSMRLIGNIRSANIEKATKFLTDALSKQQMRAMSKENKPYLYIYERDGGYYYYMTESATFDYSSMASKGKELGRGITIKYNDGSDHLITSTAALRISYKKDGTFAECPKTITITLGSGTRVIQFNEATGRRFVENQ